MEVTQDQKTPTQVVEAFRQRQPSLRGKRLPSGWRSQRSIGVYYDGGLVIGMVAKKDKVIVFYVAFQPNDPQRVELSADEAAKLL